jgi:hypothetical protein
MSGTIVELDDADPSAERYGSRDALAIIMTLSVAVSSPVAMGDRAARAHTSGSPGARAAPLAPRPPVWGWSGGRDEMRLVVFDRTGRETWTAFLDPNGRVLRIESGLRR